MVSNSLNVMQEAVETIRAAFLLPQKDLKCAFASFLLLPSIVVLVCTFCGRGRTNGAAVQVSEMPDDGHCSMSLWHCAGIISCQSS